MSEPVGLVDQRVPDLPLRVGTYRRPSTVTTLRQRNRARVLTQIVLDGRTTRADIARECGMSAAAATKIVAELTNEGLVMETGSLSSQGGRPIALIERRPEGAYLIGADVGERGVAVELFDFAMNRVDREFSGGGATENPQTIAADIGRALAALRGRNPGAWERLAGVGLGLPGIVESSPDGTQTLYAQSMGWPPVPIPQLVDVSVPVLAENGAKTLAKAEQWMGAAKGIDHAIVALLGRGVGLGLISDGGLQRGSAGSASEWGHVVVERGGRKCRCGRRGCIEAYLGADAMLAAWAERGGTFDGDGWRAIGALLTSSDPGAQAVVDEAVDVLGQGLGGLVNLTNPQRVVIGGWVGLRLMEHLTPRIEAAVRENALDRPGSQFELLPATFGGDTVAVGAALLPLEAVISRGLAR